MVKEITNKAFRKRMAEEGLGYIHLYRDSCEGYHYIVTDKDHAVWLKDTIIYLPCFNQQPIDGWIDDIKYLIEK